VEKYGRDIQATDDNITRFVCWITKATNTHPEYLILVALHCNKCNSNAPQYYVAHTLSLFLNIIKIFFRLEEEKIYIYIYTYGMITLIILEIFKPHVAVQSGSANEFLSHT
jgi:hypothetical protein